MRFAADVAHIPRARRWVVEQATHAGASDDALRVVALLASELVTNAVQHGPPGGEVTVAVERRAGQLRVAVADESPLLPAILDPDLNAVSGRGVMLVDRLSARWGVEERPGAKSVWFEVGL